VLPSANFLAKLYDLSVPLEVALGRTGNCGILLDPHTVCVGKMFRFRKVRFKVTQCRKSLRLHRCFHMVEVTFSFKIKGRCCQFGVPVGKVFKSSPVSPDDYSVELHYQWKIPLKIHPYACSCTVCKQKLLMVFSGSSHTAWSQMPLHRQSVALLTFMAFNTLV